jgi:hypothetical protein
MLKQNVDSWALMITTYIKQEPTKEALIYFFVMPLDCIRGIEFSISGVLKACLVLLWIYLTWVYRRRHAIF